MFLMSRLNAYRRAQAILTVFLAAMFFVGAAALTNSKGNYEWFPFYSWSMFALVPQEETIYRLRVIDPENTQNLIDFRQAGQLVHEPGSLPAYHLIQKMGKAITSGQQYQLSELRAAFDTNYLPTGTAYQMIQTREDPLSAWQDSGKAQTAEIIGTFVAGKRVNLESQ